MIPVFYEDKHLLVCLKPSGVLSQSTPAERESMLTLLQGQLGGEIYPVHRLDRESAGLMVFARTQAASRRLPLLGDRKYGGGSGQLALWSAYLAFPHPKTGEEMAFRALPEPVGFWAPFAPHLRQELL